MWISSKTEVYLGPPLHEKPLKPTSRKLNAWELSTVWESQGSEICSLTKLFQKVKPFVINTDFKSTFNNLKNTFKSDPTLIFRNLEEPFLLNTDASAFAIETVFLQGTVDKDRLYASRILCLAETRYTKIEVGILCHCEGRKTLSS